MRIFITAVGAKVTFNCVERKILHPTLVNVVLHRDAEDLVDEPSVFEPGVQAGNPR